MKILLLGKDGQLGRELQRSLKSIADVVALGRRVERDGCGDLSKLGLLLGSIRDLRPDVVVNAAAYTAVDRAESDVWALDQVNALAPAAIAAELAKTRALLVHYSSDYIFDGLDAAWRSEQSIPSPLNAYGRSKLSGEFRIRQTACRHLIFRTSWLYSAHRDNFAIRILRQAALGETIRVADDQIGAPTAAQLVADVTTQSIEAVQHDYAHSCRVSSSKPFGREGIYHVVAAGSASRFSYARHLVRLASHHSLLAPTAERLIVPVKTVDQSTAALRPMHSLLATSKLTANFGIELPAWEKHLERFITQLGMRIPGSR
jgi:dTDP-4-dehydrorhamnose reductase